MASVETKDGDGVTKWVDMLNVCFGRLYTCSCLGNVNWQSKKTESCKEHVSIFPHCSLF